MAEDKKKDVKKEDGKKPLTNKELIDQQRQITARLAPKDPLKILQEIGKAVDSLTAVADELKSIVKAQAEAQNKAQGNK